MGIVAVTPNVRHYACVAAMAAFPVEAVLLELLRDDRLARNAEALQSNLEEELLWPEAVPSNF